MHKSYSLVVMEREVKTIKDKIINIFINFFFYYIIIILFIYFKIIFYKIFKSYI